MSRFDRLFAKVRSDIERVGWSAIGVFPTEGDDQTITFTYTVGMTEKTQPELIVFGLSPQLAHGLLHSAIEALARHGSYQDGERYDQIIEDFDVEMRAIDPSEAEMNVAISFYDPLPISALQIVWPDDQGRFPGEADIDSKIELLQTPEAHR